MNVAPHSVCTVEVFYIIAVATQLVDCNRFKQCYNKNEYKVGSERAVNCDQGKISHLGQQMEIWVVPNKRSTKRSHMIRNGNTSLLTICCHTF